jgi:hypothetical protein
LFVRPTDRKLGGTGELVVQYGPVADLGTDNGIAAAFEYLDQAIEFTSFYRNGLQEYSCKVSD